MFSKAVQRRGRGLFRSKRSFDRLLITLGLVLAKDGLTKMSKVFSENALEQTPLDALPKELLWRCPESCLFRELGRP